MHRLPILTCTVLLVMPCQAGDPPANSSVAVSDSFDRQTLGKEWHVNTGEWKIEDGVLTAREIPADQHSAAARRIVETENAVYEFRFRFTGQGKAIHLGFDPARGELKKKGHLFSVIITPTSWKILKHVDKNRREEDPNETLAHGTLAVQPDGWHTLRVTTWHQYVTARLDDTHKLTASHQTFGVRKPTLVFRCIGDGVQLDDLHVWKEKK